MNDLGVEQSIFDSSGKPLFFMKDKRIPVEMDYEKLQPFDEIKYISEIASFIEAKSKKHRHNFKKVIKKYFNLYQADGMFSITPFLIDVLIENTGLTLKQIEKMPRSDVLNRLYELGCPELYAFHKTAEETTRFADHSVDPRKIHPNPFANPGNVSMTIELKHIDRYTKREGDVKPYIIAFPLAEICQIQDESLKLESSEKRMGNDFNTGFVSLRQIKPEQLNTVTEKMKIFAIDPNRYQKLESFSNQIK